MEAPLPFVTPEQNSSKIEEILNIGNDSSFKLNIFSENDNYLIIKIVSNNIENAEIDYIKKYNLNELYSLHKYFRQYDTITEVIKSLENNKALIYSKTKNNAFNIELNNYDMILNIQLYLMSGDINIINIKMDKIKKSEKEIIAKLKEYIKYIKSIPGVNQLIYDYEHKNNINVIKKSNIIKNIKDFYFIYETLCKKLNKIKFNFTQKYNALIDGDSANNFHLKCDNIGPNLSIVKTKENLIFGGFTMNNWSGNRIYKRDNLSFVFNFQNKKIHGIKHDRFAIWCENRCSINFLWW